jgi:hypothetical protein
MMSMRLPKGILSAAAMAIPDVVKQAISNKRDGSIYAEVGDESMSMPSTSASDTLLGAAAQILGTAGSTTSSTIAVPSSPTQGALVISSSFVMPTLTDEMSRRSDLIMQVVIGLVGYEEWYSAQTLNISR